MTLRELKPYTLMKQKIPKALREQVWLKTFGKVFNHKCYVTWCTNLIDPFNFEVGHIIPESKGGATNLDNLLPICSKCNKSMGSQYTIHEFSSKFDGKNKLFECFRLCTTSD